MKQDIKDSEEKSNSELQIPFDIEGKNDEGVPDSSEIRNVDIEKPYNFSGFGMMNDQDLLHDKEGSSERNSFHL